VLGSALILGIAVVAVVTGSGPPAPAPPPGREPLPRPGDPFAYVAARESRFVARATAGSGQPLFIQSPGGAAATAARVAALSGSIGAAARVGGIDPAILEGVVFVESAGRPDVVAGSDPSAAAGLTQILADTGRTLLGMHIDLARGRRLMSALGKATSPAQARKLLARLMQADDRFNPPKELAATVRYLRLARQRFGRSDLAVVSYHMGLGNLEHVLGEYDGGQPVPYAQLYFDTAPDRHPAAYRLLSGFGDQSSLYYWRVLGAVQIMHLYRSDRAALRRLVGLETAANSTAPVLHPPDRSPAFSDPASVSAAYAQRILVPLPGNATELGLAYSPAMGAGASRLGVPSSLYRGLRPVAIALLSELAARVRALSGSRRPLTVQSTVADMRYQSKAGLSDPRAATGYSFELARRYSGPAQAAALQAMLDRLQSLNLIAWERTPATIAITVASDAAHVIAGGV
jgi:hypothetical protein